MSADASQDYNQDLSIPYYHVERRGYLVAIVEGVGRSYTCEIRGLQSGIVYRVLGPYRQPTRARREGRIELSKR